MLGFLGVSTARGTRPLQRLIVSIPCWVFWASRQCDVRVGDLGVPVFQSRAGFSGRLDVARSLRYAVSGSVSIPCWVFWASRLSVRDVIDLPAGFNPVLGFLGVSTSDDVFERITDTIGFNPVLGFLGVSTLPWPLLQHLQ